MSPQATEEVSYRKAVSFDGCKSGTSFTQSFPLRGRCRRRRRKRCRTKKHSVPSDAITERRSPLPSSGLRGTPDATLPSRGGILRAVRSDGRKNGTKSTPQVLPLEGKVSPQATEEVSYRIADSFDGCKSGTKITSSVIRLAGDAGCHPPLKGRDFTRSPLRRTQKRNEFHPVLPLEGKVSLQATEEVTYRKAASFDECKNGTSSTQSFPLRGRCRRRRRKRCRTGSQFVSTDAEAQRKSPLPSSGLRGTPDATLPSRGGILRAARSDGRKSGTKSAPKSFPSRGRCRRRRRKRCRIEKQYLSTDAKMGRVPLPSPSPRGEGVAAGDGRGVVPDRSFFRRMQKRNEDHLFRHPACVRRRMPPSPQGEGFCAQPVPMDAKTERVPPPVLPLEGKVSPQATEEVSYRKAVSFDGCENGTNNTSSVIRLAGDAGCHPPLEGRDFARRSVPVS